MGTSEDGADPVESMFVSLEAMREQGAAKDEIQRQFWRLMRALSPSDQKLVREIVASAEQEAPAPQGVNLDPAVSPDDPDLIMVCAVCDEALQRFTTATEQTWIHVRAFRSKDHEAKPVVQRRSERATEQCDFCGVHEKLHWRFTGAHMQARYTFDEPILNEIGEFSKREVKDYGTSWTACRRCSGFIRDRDMEGLFQHRLRMRTIELPSAEIARRANGELLAMWSSFLPTVHMETYVGPKREPAKLNPRMMPKLQSGLLKFWRHEGLRDLFFSNRTRNGQIHHLPGVHLGLDDEFAIQFPPGRPIPQNVWDNHIQHLCAGIEGAELWWASHDFTQLAIMAGKDFDKLIISREELPAKFGFMMFEEPIGELPRGDYKAAIRGLSWTLVPGGIWMNLYVQGEDGDPVVDVEQMRIEFGFLKCPNSGGGIPFDTEIPIPEGEDFSYATTIFAAWFLMQQPGVAETEDAPADKKFVRAYQRAHNNRKPPAVRLLDLRKQKHRSGAAREGQPGRKLTVRVFRSGHWKRQAYGVKRGLRKTIYISPYIAGPEGAPLKERPPVVKVI